jgi:hypothetical protein
LNPTSGIENVNSKDHIYFGRELPSWASTPYLSHSPGELDDPSSNDEQRTIKISLDKDIFRITEFTMRINLISPDQKKSLLAGEAIIPSIASACKVVALFSKHSLNFVFPYPINKNTIKTHITRSFSRTM